MSIGSLLCSVTYCIMDRMSRIFSLHSLNHQFNKQSGCFCLSLISFFLSLSFALALSLSPVYKRVNVPFPSPSLLFVLLFFHLVFLSLFPPPASCSCADGSEVFPWKHKELHTQKKEEKKSTQPQITTDALQTSKKTTTTGRDRVIMLNLL